MSADVKPQQARVRRQRQRGMSIIELMVGLVVALVVGIAASSSAVVFTASQRQGIGVGGIAVNTSTVLAALKNDVATAGLGFFGEGVYLCDRLNLSNGNAVLLDNAAFAPVQVTRVGSLDRVDVLQSSRVHSGASARLQLATTGGDASLLSFLPGAVGETVVLSPSAPGDPCVVRTITAVTAAAGDDPLTFAFGAGGKHNDGVFTVNPTYSSQGGSVTLLGTLSWNRYRLNGTDLVLERPLDGTSAVLARNVVAFRAQYGVSSGVAGSKTLENWVDATGAFASINSVNIARVRALRIGVVTRSPQREKPGSSGNCEASLAKPQLFGNEVEPDVLDWGCYRFRVATVVVPMRNIVIGVKSS
jgi:type IV pilus assembly protein PilW